MAAAKRRERELARRTFHLRRVTAQVKAIEPSAIEPLIAEARVILNDFSSKGISLFSAQPMTVGQEVAITLEHPTRIYLRGRVVWCMEHDVDSRIMSSNAFSFRMGIEFIFETQEEEAAIKAFCDGITREHLAINRKKAA